MGQRGCAGFERVALDRPTSVRGRQMAARRPWLIRAMPLLRMRAIPLLRMRAIRLLAVVGAGVLGLAFPAWASARLKIADPGRVTAGVVRCGSGFQTECGGSIEIEGEEYGFAGGALTGRVERSGAFVRGDASFGVAMTDPATQGPFQLSLKPVATGSARGVFVSSGSPLGVGGVSGLYFGVALSFYIQLSGAEPNALGGPGPGVGGGCTIGSVTQPIKAAFGPTLASLFSGGGVPYDQANGVADLTASRLAFPGAQDCAGQEAALDEQLGLPGQGSIQIFLRFTPAVVSTAYRAAHPLHRHHRR